MTDTTPALAANLGDIAAVLHSVLDARDQELRTARQEVADYQQGHAEVREALGGAAPDEPTADAVRRVLATLRCELAEARDALSEALATNGAQGMAYDNALHERDEAVAETARARTVYRDALARWRDELTQLRKAVTAIVARRARERPDDIIVDALRAALDGATTTGPETASAPICGYRDHDLATNRPLVCVLPAGHPPVAHGFDFVSAEGGA